MSAISDARDKRFIEWQSQQFNIVDDNLIRSIKYEKFISLITNPQLLDYLKNRFPDSDSIVESWSRIKFNVEEKPKCPYCGKPVVWIGKKTKLYTKYCCITCRARCEETSKRREETYLRKWGHTSCFLSPEYKAQLKEKTGYESPNQMPDKIQRRHETMVAHYGTDRLSQIPEILEKTKETNLKKFGYENPMQSPTFRKNRRLKKLNIHSVGELKEYINKVGKRGFMVKLRYNTELKEMVTDATTFLKESASMSERVYCILNDIKEQPVCPWCGEPLRFRKLNAGYFATCGEQECKLKGIAAGAKNHDFKAIAQKVKDTWKVKRENMPPKPPKEKGPVYTRSARCWDKLMARISEMGYRYISSDEEVFTLECVKCGTQFDIDRAIINIRYREGKWGICPKCNLKDSTYRSMFEKEVCKVVNELVGERHAVMTNKYINGYEVDMQVPDLKIAIECNGLYWHSELYKPEDYHIKKKQAVESSGFLLVYIWEDEWIYNKEAVIEKLRLLLNGQSVTGSYDYSKLPVNIKVVPEFWWVDRHCRYPKREADKPADDAYRVFGLPVYKEKVAD